LVRVRFATDAATASGIASPLLPLRRERSASLIGGCVICVFSADDIIEPYLDRSIMSASRFIQEELTVKG
jgi:hypothetical protein